MRWKTTVLLLLATIGLGAYISLYDLRQPTPEQRERLSKQVLDVDEEAVTQLVLDLPQAKVTLTRSGGAWKVAPQGFRANPTIVGEILSQLNPLIAERVLTSSAKSGLEAKTYGLDPGVGWLSVVAGEKARTLLFGETTAVAQNRYAKLADRAQIFVVPSTLFTNANVPLEMYRDPQLMRLDPSIIARLSLKSSPFSFVLTRADGMWQIAQPIADRAEAQEVTRLLNSLGAISIKRFIDDAPRVEELSTWGFDHPKAEVTLVQRGDPTKPTTLFFGRSLPSDASLVYAKRSDEPALYAVEASDVDHLIRDPHGLRATACFSAFPSTVKKIQFVSAGKTWALERVDAAPGTESSTGPSWRELGSTTLLDMTRINSLLATLTQLRASGFVEDAPSDLSRYGLNPAMATISLWTQGQSEEQQLLIGKQVESSPDRYGLMKGRPAVVRLPPTINELLTTPSESYHVPSTTTPSTVSSSSSPTTPASGPAQKSSAP